MSIEARRIGKYELRERLGGGSLTDVWKAFDIQLQRYVAIKLLRDELQNDPDFSKRFVREARMLASLHHPNIIQIHDFQVSQPYESKSTIAYMVMDYIAGQTLEDYIHNTSARGQFPAASDIVHLFLSIGSAIDYAHQQGMIHRDIKPANILLNKQRTTYNSMGEPILTDFGIAKLLGMSSTAMSGSWQGTPHYIAPEQVQGYAGNERSDIYSLGVILYEVCTGVLPFRGENPAVIAMQHVNAPPPAPQLINPNISPALSTVILRSLAKDPASRFESASSMALAIAKAFNVPVPENLQQTIQVNNPSAQRSVQSSSTSAHLSAEMPLASVVTPQPLITPANSTPGLGEQMPALVNTSKESIYTPASLTQSPLSASVQTPAVTVIPPPAVTPTLQPTPAASYPHLRKRTPKRRILIAMAALLLVILGGFGLSAFYVLSHKETAVGNTSHIVGYAFYSSSGLLSEASSQGIDDQFQIALQNIPATASGKGYYGWLLGDRHKNTKQNRCKAAQELVPLGILPIHNNAINMFYAGDAKHTNLIGCTSRFLITEESSASIPTKPSTDKNTWRYYAELPQIPNPKDALHYSALDLMRHLLFEGGGLKQQNIHGGTDIRFLRNAQKIWEWASSARDTWGNTTGSNLMHRQIIRILDYLDGTAPNLVSTELPRSAQPQLLVDPILGAVGMIDLPKQNASYVDRISRQLSTIALDPGVTAQMRSLAIQLNKELNAIQSWLEKVHQDAKQLVKLDSKQLQQPAALSMLDDMQTFAGYAFVGLRDPATNKVQAGIAQLHDGIQQLATFDVAAYSSH